MLDSGARGSTTTFVERGIGDVLIAWENEAYPRAQGARPRQVRDRHAVASRSSPSRRSPLVDKVVDKHGTRKVAEAYLEYLYTPGGPGDRRQELLPPARCSGRGKYARRSSPTVNLFTIDEVFGGWDKAQETHFKDGGVFDQIYGSAEVIASGAFAARSVRLLARAWIASRLSFEKWQRQVNHSTASAACRALCDKFISFARLLRLRGERPPPKLDGTCNRGSTTCSIDWHPGWPSRSPSCSSPPSRARRHHAAQRLL